MKNLYVWPPVLPGGLREAAMRTILGMCLLCAFTPSSHAQDVILQGFYWNSHPGDITDQVDGGIWWDTLEFVAPEIGAAGFATVWTPPMTKSFAGRFDMGYGPYDYFDLGEFDSKGTVRTRHGNRTELENMIAALHANGVRVMADVVLNHRAGGDAQAQEEAGPDTRFLVFNPPSGRLPSGPEDFHPNNFHSDENPPFRDPIFFEDVCYFNNPTTDPPENPDGTMGEWYFGAPNSIGEMGVDLIEWARFLDSVGFDDLRLDAVKHIEPDYLAKFILEMRPGEQPFALGEFFDFNAGAIEFYHASVENSSNTGGDQKPDLSMFDFPLRGSLQAILNDGAGNQDLFQSLGGAGLVWGSALSGDDVVTWLDTHDTDRTGLVEDSEGCQIPFGNGCLRLETLDDHNPIFQDKEDMGYPVLMAGEGRPIVFWKDFYWFGLSDDITWQMALRKATATGASDHIQNMSGFWPQDFPYDFDNNGGNMFAMRRDGTTGGVSDGMVLGLNDHPNKTNAVFVNTPFSNKYLKDYSDGFLFETTEAFGDSRALIKAAPRDYTWYAPTGLYPQPPDAQGSFFQMDATPGGCPHFVALRVADANNFIVNGAPIAPGDEVAVKNTAGQVVGIGRIGQRFQWDGAHDMIIEVLGAPSENGMNAGETLRLFAFDASLGQEVEVGSLTYAPGGQEFNFSPDRPDSPNRNGNNPSILVATTAGGTFTCAGISLITGFNSDACSILDIVAGQQFPCDFETNTYAQEVTVTYLSAPADGSLHVNGMSFPITGSPQTVLLEGLISDGAPVGVMASFNADCSFSKPAVFNAPLSCSDPLNCQQSIPSDPTYNDGWDNSDNDGSGFGNWVLTSQFNNPSTGGRFVFTSTDNGNGDTNGDGDIDNAGRAWGLYANSGDVSNAVRPFTEALQVGGTFSLGMDNGFIDLGGTIGFGLQNANGENRFQFFFTGGASTYQYTDAGSGGNAQEIPGLFYTDQGLRFTIKLTSADTYEASILRLDGGTIFMISGTLAAAGDITQVRLFNANAGSGGQFNAYFSDLEICAPPPPCTITGLSAGAQTACLTATNEYSQEVIVTYENAPEIGQLVVNGQFFEITGSPQTVELTELDSDGQPVDVTVSFSADPECLLSQPALFNAPEACPPCDILDLTALSQSACVSATNAYTQDIRVTYLNPPASGDLVVNGQSFPITGSPQIITLVGLDSDGQPVNVTASFSEDPQCSISQNNLFTAPEACPPCAILDVQAGTQKACLPLTNTFSQELIITYQNPPAEGFLNVNGQLFAITGSPQTVLLGGLNSDGGAVDVAVNFTNEPTCQLSANALFTAPTACFAASDCQSDNSSNEVYFDGWQNGDNGGSGFAPWVLATNNNNPSTGGHFRFTSTNNGNGDANGDGDIDVNGTALGLYANSGDLSEATRPFALPLTPNTQLSFGFDNGFIDIGGTVGFGLQNASGQNLLEAFFIGGEATYRVNDANGAQPTGLPFTDEGLIFQITVGANDTYEMSVVQLESGFTQTFAGRFKTYANGQIPTQIRFFNFDAGFNAPANMYIDQFEVCRLTCNLSLLESQSTCPGASEGAFTVAVDTEALPITYTVNDGQPVTLSSNTFSLSGLAGGSYTIAAENAAGCTSSIDVVISEVDLGPPTITCPGDIVVDNTDGQCGASVEFAATATDDCGATISYSQEPGSFFPIGTTQVIATATDAAGNTSTCTITVTVVDREAPSVTAEWQRLSGEEDDDELEGKFKALCSATDGCDPAPSIASVLAILSLTNPKVRFKRKNRKKLEINVPKNSVKVEAPDPQAFWAEILAAGGIPLTDAEADGFKVELEEDEKELEFKFNRDGSLKKVEGPALTLVCTATDAAGNSAEAIATLVPPHEEEDDDDEEDDLHAPTSSIATDSNANNPLRQFHLYPNPATEMVTLDLSAFHRQDIEVVFRNYLGQIVWYQQLDNVEDTVQSIPLNHSAFSAGLYTVQLIHEGKMYTKRFIVQ